MATAPTAAAPSPAISFPAGRVVDVRATASEELPGASVGWDVQYAQLGTGRFRGRWLGVHTSSLQICLEDWSLGILKRGHAPRGSVTFLVPARSAGSARIQGRPVGAGGMVVLFEGEELDYRSSGPARLLSVSVERAALEGHVRALLGRRLSELRLEGRLSGRRTDDAALLRLGQELAALAASDPRFLQDPVLALAREREIVAALFARFESPGAPEPSRRRALARRAEAWLRENLAQPSTIADLCGAVHVSERTLHEVFRESLGTTPKAYLKTLRLNSAHRDLHRGGARTRVTDVALDWGFLHFGWFSQDYRRLFGETPSQTLHRGRAKAGRGDSCGPGPRSQPAESAQVSSVCAM